MEAALHVYAIAFLCVEQSEDLLDIAPAIQLSSAIGIFNNVHHQQGI